MMGHETWSRRSQLKSCGFPMLDSSKANERQPDGGIHTLRRLKVECWRQAIRGSLMGSVRFCDRVN